MTSKIFISYRRADTLWPTGRLHDYLSARFGPNAIFMDITDIEPGEDFVEAIENAVSQSSVLIAVIGPKWVSITDDSEQRRLDNPDDVVRVEIASALTNNLRVIPILIDNTPMPKRTQLPDNLARLGRLNALRIRSESFRYDASQLTKTIEKLLDMTERAVMAGYWIDQTKNIHLFFRQVKEHVVGYYRFASTPGMHKTGVFWGVMTGDTANFEWRWLDDTLSGHAVAQAPDNAAEISLSWWIGQISEARTNEHFKFVSSDMPDWVSDDDFSEFADFLAD